MAPVGSSLLLVRGSALHNEILCGLVTKPVCFNQDVKALVPNSKVVPVFLTLFIRGFAEAMLKLVSSAGNTAGVLDTKLIKAFAINLPKTEEQNAIASVLTEMGYGFSFSCLNSPKLCIILQQIPDEFEGRVRQADPARV